MSDCNRLSNEAALARIEPWSGVTPRGYMPNWLGAQTSVFFWAHWLGRELVANALAGPRTLQTRRPTFADGEIFFQHANIIRSILRDRPSGKGRFIAVELGGGHGPHVVDTAMALRQLRPDLKPFLVVVEAVPTYVEWCRHHFTVNDLNPDDHWIISGIVSAEPIPELFFLQPRGFGNQIADASVMEILRGAAKDRSTAVAILERLAGRGLFVRGGELADGWPRADSKLPDPSGWTADSVAASAVQSTTAEIGFISALTLPSILAPLPYVDFMDVDIQYAEIKVIPPQLGLLKKKVRLLNIGTHSKKIHAELVTLFRGGDWQIGRAHV